MGFPTQSHPKILRDAFFANAWGKTKLQIRATYEKTTSLGKLSPGLRVVMLTIVRIWTLH
jgi:hypothetical protein